MVFHMDQGYYIKVMDLLLKVNMTRNELCEGIDHGDNRLAEVLTFDAGSTPKGSRPSHVSSFCRGR